MERFFEIYQDPATIDIKEQHIETIEDKLSENKLSFMRVSPYTPSVINALRIQLHNSCREAFKVIAEPGFYEADFAFYSKEFYIVKVAGVLCEDNEFIPIHYFMPRLIRDYSSHEIIFCLNPNDLTIPKYGYDYPIYEYIKQIATWEIKKNMGILREIKGRNNIYGRPCSYYCYKLVSELEILPKIEERNRIRKEEEDRKRKQREEEELKHQAYLAEQEKIRLETEKLKEKLAQAQRIQRIYAMRGDFSKYSNDELKLEFSKEKRKLEELEREFCIHTGTEEQRTISELLKQNDPLYKATKDVIQKKLAYLKAIYEYRDWMRVIYEEKYHEEFKNSDY